LCILISGNSRRELEIKANTAVGVIHNWCERYKMTMSLTKILAVVFRRTLKKLIIMMGTTILPVKKDTRYLGSSWIRNSIFPNISTHPWRKRGHKSIRS
jgi:hypothetical protein